MTKINFQAWITSTRRRLEEHQREFLTLEVYAILSQVLEKKRGWIITHSDTLLTPAQYEALEGKVQQLIAGVPLPYITGNQAFYGLDFYVTPEVLIPRPETELLVETAIDGLRAHTGSRTMIDVGTGSGNIPIALVDSVPDLQVSAIDLSPKALDIARKNINRYGLSDKITLINNDLLTGLDMKADVVLANLPYIPSERVPTLEVSRYEPVTALDGGFDGFELIRKLLSQLPSHLNPGGIALFEIDFSHAELALLEATKIMTSAKISVINDLANLPRLLKILT